jgi:hypothetical protein
MQAGGRGTPVACPTTLEEYTGIASSGFLHGATDLARMNAKLRSQVKPEVGLILPARRGRVKISVLFARKRNAGSSPSYNYRITIELLG